MRRFIYILGAVLFISSCQEDNNGVNPFDQERANQDTVRLDIVNPPATSIAGIYQNVFKPTCANVGCHDGTFDPDFRTIESSYNTLVYQTPIKNNGDYDYRVLPGDPDGSVIMARLNNIIGPEMPIQIEPDSDWPAKGTEYISNIRNWINSGAPDVAGNIPMENHPAPILLGAGATLMDDWLDRGGGTGPIQVPSQDEELFFYFSFEHDEMNSEELNYNKIAFSSNPNDFSTADLWDLEIMASPRYERGFYGEIERYTHRIKIDPMTDLDPAYTQWYFRVYVQDNVNPITEIPTDNGIYYIKSYMSFKWQ